ncbi:MAG: translation initiation factor [Gammaproteobacteria bacterium]
MKDKHRPLPAPEPVANPFAALAGLVTRSAEDASTAAPEATPDKNTGAARGRVDVLRNTAHRGGKTVTVLKGFTGVDDAELQALARQLQKRCGAGGTVKAGAIEIQGDHRETVMAMLAEAGFRPVRAGG